VLVNDIHSGLNPTEIAEVVAPRSVEEISAALARAAASDRPLSIGGGRHAMGGQQFAAGGTLLDMRAMDRVLGLDRERGLVEVEAGIMWPELVAHLIEAQRGEGPAWGIAQKQTGADRLTVGGSVSVNGHGRGLAMAPIVADVEALRLVLPDGAVVECSRDREPDLFRLAVGGYGLVGVIAAVTLRLAPRRKLERVVEPITVPELEAAFAERIAAGFLYGDMQFAIDSASADFLHRGVFSCYRPTDPDRPIPDGQRVLVRDDWRRLLFLGHTDKSRAFTEYARHYLATSGQVYWSDLHQLADYEDGYHEALDTALGAVHPGSEMIGELYVPRPALAGFMAAAADDLRRREGNVIYGTVRLIHRDDETALPWARDDFACVVINLHTDHTPDGIAGTAAAFRGLIDIALERGGSYFLTYHRWATREQVLAAHPALPGVLREKRRRDPGGLIQSDWYRHHAGLLEDAA
jgi:FAD/FMN-containing dehydrogenase